MIASGVIFKRTSFLAAKTSPLSFFPPFLSALQTDKDSINRSTPLYRCIILKRVSVHECKYRPSFLHIKTQYMKRRNSVKE